MENSPLLSVAEARARILAAVQPVLGDECVALRSGLERVLARDIQAPHDVPPHRNAAMDGYAVRHADLPTAADSGLTVIGTAYAGHPYPGELSPASAVRIMTGAVLPPQADTVVMQEDTRSDAERVWVTGQHRHGQHVRHPGEDLRAGSTVLSTGKPLGPAELGLIASLGLGEIMVRRRPHVAFFSTGDELRSVGSTLEPGQIYDSNRYTLYGMLARSNVELHDMGVIPDQRQAIRSAFEHAALCADAIITSGGVSVGEADYVTETLSELGQVDFWKIAMKPGKPLAFGTLGAAYFFGLPGNPVSVMATFYQFVRPALQRLRGEQPSAPLLLCARSVEPLKKQAGRAEFQRGRLERAADGGWDVHTTGLQDSHILSSMSRANCFIWLPAECGGVAAGETVEVEPFERSR